jgi:DNA-binding IclR family transcriptional regulator
MPAHATAVGKALLAWSDPAVVDEVIDAGLGVIGPNTVTDPVQLRRELSLIRANGIAYEREECAIRASNGEPIRVVGSRLGGQPRRAARGLAVQTATQVVSRLIAGRPRMHF